jgi:hypothetical protein
LSRPSSLRARDQLDEASATQLLKVFHGNLPEAAKEAGRRHVAAASDLAVAVSAQLDALSSAQRITQPLAGAKRKKAAAAAIAAEERAVAASTTVAGLARGSRSSGVNSDSHVVVEGVIVPRGRLPTVDRASGQSSFVLVPSVRRHLHNLARAVSTSCRYPVLLQASPDVQSLCARVCVCVRALPLAVEVVAQ